MNQALKQPISLFEEASWGYQTALWETSAGDVKASESQWRRLS